MKIAIQGIKGSFHDQAASVLANDRAEIVPCNSFAEVFRAVESGEAPYGLVAIENNIHGSINDVYRLLERYYMWIIRSVRMQIGQALIASKPLSLTDLGTGEGIRILSQAPALSQVEQWLDANLPDAVREETHDTADSVRVVVESGDPSVLAVAGEYAAKMYGGHVVARDIQDDPDNYTRFILFQKECIDSPEATHTSIILKTNHAPGSLLRALEVFANHDCNLTKLDSHPIPGDQQHYAFYIDYEQGSNGKKVVADLEALGNSVKVLGTY